MKYNTAALRVIRAPEPSTLEIRDLGIPLPAPGTGRSRRRGRSSLLLLGAAAFGVALSVFPGM